MKAIACILAVIVSLAIGFIFGRAQGVQAVQEIFVNSCDKLGGFAVGSRVFNCERVKKERKVD